MRGALTQPLKGGGLDVCTLYFWCKAQETGLDAYLQNLEMGGCAYQPEVVLRCSEKQLHPHQQQGKEYMSVSHTGQYSLAPV